MSVCELGTLCVFLFGYCLSLVSPEADPETGIRVHGVYLGSDPRSQWRRGWGKAGKRRQPDPAGPHCGCPEPNLLGNSGHQWVAHTPWATTSVEAKEWSIYTLPISHWLGLLLGRGVLFSHSRPAFCTGRGAPAVPGAPRQMDLGPVCSSTVKR